MMPLLKNTNNHHYYTYKDYLDFPKDGFPKVGVHYEIIHGTPYMMAAPSRRHQNILGNIFNELKNFLKGKQCKTFISPFDVRLPIFNEEDDDISSVVQPDIVVYCDPDKHDEKGGKGAPDIAVEVLSPSSINMDRVRKLKLYELVGVKEYWIVDGEEHVIEVYKHNGKQFYDCLYFGEARTLTTSILEGFELKVSEIFV